MSVWPRRELGSKIGSTLTEPAHSLFSSRSGSVMERRAITPPVASPVGRPLYLPPDKAVLSLDKIAKRECKVLVVEPVK